ncbi:hypothetical protein SprV_0401637600 [Sparganum proliferum]
MLVQQLIVGLRNEKARENLLSEKKDLSWEKACDIASRQERVRQNLQQLNQSTNGVISSLEAEVAVFLVNTAVSPPKQRSSAPQNNYRHVTVVKEEEEEEEEEGEGEEEEEEHTPRSMA